MDISSYAAPVPPRQSAVTRRLAVAVGALFVTGVIAATGALLGIANRLDNEEINKTRFFSARALENRIYYAAVDRIGAERGFTFIGQSRIIDVNGELLAATETDQPTILYADIEPERARNKKIVNIPGKHEVHRTADRRPEMYGPLMKK